MIDSYHKYWPRSVNNRNLHKLFGSISKEVERAWIRDIFRNVFSNRNTELSEPADYINHGKHFEAQAFLNGLLVVEDKLSMANGVAIYFPFMAECIRLSQIIRLNRKA